ncbi:phosphatidylethanolamine N-methyltransferase isoform X1 [Entelurus aequoreus]|uniref:phosphatidylethanolamine N-methyltransferase isoform X1 n=1 Tax=Entelurus aequoreus TaxID=161455 RepID=UPI002B1DC14C|nr:phosphatidylethanolamine N-methyltransferase isoform X1 [Entelurus aequoreus]
MTSYHSGAGNNPAEKYRRERDCCGGLNNVDYSKMDLKVFEEVFKQINFHDSNFHIAVIAIIFNPLFWNVPFQDPELARTTREALVPPRPRPPQPCFFARLIHFSAKWEYMNIPAVGIPMTPDIVHMTVVMKTQARWELMDRPEVFYFGVLFIVLGSLLVVSSFLALGFTGTFLGDYFGILMDEKVTGFPFSFIDNPMYWGSTSNYLGLALVGASPVGLLLTAIVALVYKIAIGFEGPFTEHIYQERRRKHE